MHSYLVSICHSFSQFSLAVDLGSATVARLFRRKQRPNMPSRRQKGPSRRSMGKRETDSRKCRKSENEVHSFVFRPIFHFSFQMPGSCRGEEAIGQGVKKFMPQQEMPATSCDNLPILSYLQIYVNLYILFTLTNCKYSTGRENCSIAVSVQNSNFLQEAESARQAADAKVGS